MENCFISLFALHPFLQDMSRQFYDTFVAELSTAAHEAFNPTPPKAKARKPEVPPEDPLIFFHEGIYAGKYSEYDDRCFSALFCWLGCTVFA